VSVYERQVQVHKMHHPHQRNQSQESKLLKRKQEEYQEQVRSLERLRQVIAMKETDLVTIYRELIAWDYFSPEEYFSEEYLLKKQKADKEMD